MSDANELEAIRARHEATAAARQYRERHEILDIAIDAHADRATLLRLLDVAREELDKEQVSHLKTRAKLTGIREAAGKALLSMKLLQQNSEACAVQHHDRPVPHSGWLADTARDLRRLAAALKEPPTRAQGESS